MKNGLWVWPPDSAGQTALLKKVARSQHIVAALKAIAKSKDGLSNAEIDDVLEDNSHWMTLWVLRQLMSIGFIEYHVDFFGNSGKYTITDLGKQVLAKITGQTAPTMPPRRPTQSTH